MGLPASWSLCFPPPLFPTKHQRGATVGYPLRYSFLSFRKKAKFHKKNRDFLRYTYDYIGKMSNASILSLSLSAQCQILRLSRCIKKKKNQKKTKISSILIFICYRY